MTEFGKWLTKFQIDHDITNKELAYYAGFKVNDLSSIKAQYEDMPFPAKRVLLAMEGLRTKAGISEAELKAFKYQALRSASPKKVLRSWVPYLTEDQEKRILEILAE